MPKYVILANAAHTLSAMTTEAEWDKHRTEWAWTDAETGPRFTKIDEFEADTDAEAEVEYQRRFPH